MDALISLHEVSLQLNSKLILDKVNLKINRGERVSIYGRSGSGKSTVLKMIVGGYQPTSGEIFFNGRLIDPGSVNTVRRTIAYIDQEPVPGAEIVRDSLLLPFKYQANQHLQPTPAQIDEILAAINLAPAILEQRTSEISGGEKQRIVIARALLLRKNIFLMDEVTSALDTESKQAVFELFCRETEYTIVSVNHDFEWMQHCRRFIEIRNGRIVDDHADFRKLEKLKEQYLPQRNS